MRFYPDWSLYNLHQSLGGASHLTSPKHTRFRLTAIAVVYLENVTVSCLFTTFPPGTAARLPAATGDIRKDIRRPRFSFFRFNCQTACLPPAQARQLGRVLTVLLTEELACVHPRGSRRPKERAPDACAAVRGGVYSGCCRCLSTANVKFFLHTANHARFSLSPLSFSALQTVPKPDPGHSRPFPDNLFVRCKNSAARARPPRWKTMPHAGASTAFSWPRGSGAHAACAPADSATTALFVPRGNAIRHAD